MSQINPYYTFKVLKLLPGACAIPLSEEEKQGKSEEELFTDGVKVEMIDAAGKKHWLILHRETFPICGLQPDEKPVKKGSTGFLGITSAENCCIDLAEFEKLERRQNGVRPNVPADKETEGLPREETRRSETGDSNKNDTGGPDD